MVSRLRGFVVQTARGAKRLVRARLSTCLCTADRKKVRLRLRRRVVAVFRFFRLFSFLSFEGRPSRASRRKDFPFPSAGTAIARAFFSFAFCFWTSSENVSAASRLDAAIAFVRKTFLVAACASRSLQSSVRSSSKTRGVFSHVLLQLRHARVRARRLLGERERARLQRRLCLHQDARRLGVRVAHARRGRGVVGETRDARVASRAGRATRLAKARSRCGSGGGRGRPGCCADARRLEGTRGPCRRRASRVFRCRTRAGSPNASGGGAGTSGSGCATRGG